MAISHDSEQRRSKLANTANNEEEDTMSMSRHGMFICFCNLNDDKSRMTITGDVWIPYLFFLLPNLILPRVETIEREIKGKNNFSKVELIMDLLGFWPLVF